MNLPHLQNKVALVTGGAQGLGAAIVETLAQTGMQVVIGDIQTDKANQLETALTNQGLNVASYSLNVTDAANIESVLQTVADTYRHLDVVVNNAGIDITKPISKMSLAEWDRVIAINLRGPFIVSQKALALMAPQQTGHIINITSTAAKRAWKNAAAYHASKWGLLGFSHALFTEAREHHVKVTAVVAGGMQTPFILDRFPDVDPNNLQDPHNVAQVIKNILSLPPESVIPEVMVLPLNETSWP